MVKKILFVLVISIILIYSKESNSKTISNPNWFITLSSPDNFFIQEKNGNYVIFHSSEKGMIMIMPHKYSNEEELQKFISSGGFLTKLKNISILNNFQKIENGVSLEMTGRANETDLKLNIIGLISPYKTKGVLIVSLDPLDSNTNTFLDLSKDIYKNLKFDKPNIDYEKLIQIIKKTISGKKLTFEDNRLKFAKNGTVILNEKQIYNFCSNKSFYGVINSYYSISTDDISTYSGSEKSLELIGNWDIKYDLGDILLILNSSDGKIYYNLIEYKNNSLYIQGNEYKISKGICE